MLKFLSRSGALVVEKLIPNAFVFAVLLTFVVFICGILLEDNSAIEMITFWGDGFFNLLQFSVQMALVLITGFALAKTKLVDSFLNLCLLRINTATQAVFFMSLISLISCYINWGFGLVIMGLFAQKIALKLKKLNYGLLLASGYSGFLVWHGGISGSIPLKVSSSDKILNSFNLSPLSFEQTIFSQFNLVILFSVSIVIIITNFLAARKSNNKELEIEQVEENLLKNKENLQDFTPAQKLENSPVLSLLVFLFGLTYFILHLQRGGAFNLNMMIFAFLFIGIFLSNNLSSYIEYFTQAIKGSSGILLQFPFYAGIMSMMSKSNLASSLSEFFISISNENTFVLFTYLSAGLINFFVPSGGGQWVVQAPIILPAAIEMGVNIPKVIMAIAWGDAWSNMIQPFWALPLLSIAGVKLKQIMGHCILIFLYVGLVTSLILVFL